MKNLCRAVAVLSVALMTACTSVPGGGLAGYSMRGSLQDKTYTSPEGSFRVRMPELLQPGARVQDQMPRPNALWVSFSDDLCREFIAIEYPGELGDLTMDAWVDSAIIPQLTQANATVLDRKTVQTKYGSGVYLHYKQPNAASCSAIKIKDGKRVDVRPDAEVGAYNLYVGGHFYRIMYVLNDDPDLDHSWVKRRPLDQLLDQFFRGFEILRKAPN